MPELPSRPRLIVVKLARRAVRNELIQAARVRREVSTDGTNLPTPSRRFYINERLTKTNRLLFHQAREIAGGLKWRYVWTRDGKVFARQRHGTRCYRLRTESDLARVFGHDAVRSSEAATA